MNTIENRNDVGVLVNSFYAKIRKDELLGPIFNSHIPDEKWPEHLSNLFGIAKFKGNPTKKHINVDQNLNYTIEQTHFGKWLQLWFETIDELYVGTLAKKAKDSARNMSTAQFIMIWKNRPENLERVGK